MVDWTSSLTSLRKCLWMHIKSIHEVVGITNSTLWGVSVSDVLLLAKNYYRLYQRVLLFLHDSLLFGYGLTFCVLWLTTFYKNFFMKPRYIVDLCVRTDWALMCCFVKSFPELLPSVVSWSHCFVCFYKYVLSGQCYPILLNVYVYGLAYYGIFWWYNLATPYFVFHLNESSQNILNIKCLQRRTSLHFCPWN